ncbi:MULTISPECIES: hypothetical protein [unclassified Arthrobacter]|uniref:hypothetical protein n=1 Tax=unclassified Arthrobacter TaxID=235627 RepID=UPI001CC7ADF1|nr:MULTISPECIES: hypothetical protein [unclassified Arthrobacter]MDE8586145.1 hypothetical protein [Arthrobacter sp. NQ4]BCW78414.1 hypothetical protein NicSoilC5_04330 [Arthrobacter sp. NicSoilC5]
MNSTAPAGTQHIAARRPTGNRAAAWGWFQKVLSAAIVAAAVIIGVQLGLNGPAVSPVQTTVMAADTVGPAAAATPNQQGRTGPARGATTPGGNRGRR